MYRKRTTGHIKKDHPIAAQKQDITTEDTSEEKKPVDYSEDHEPEMADDNNDSEDDQPPLLVMREGAYEDGVNSTADNEPIDHDDNNDDDDEGYVIF